MDASNNSFRKREAKLIESKRNIDNSANIFGYNGQIKLTKINTDMKTLNINQHDLLDIYRTLKPTIAEYIFFSHVHRTLTKIEYMLSYETKVIKPRQLKLYKACSQTTLKLKYK